MTIDELAKKKIVIWAIESGYFPVWKARTNIAMLIIVSILFAIITAGIKLMAGYEVGLLESIGRALTLGGLLAMSYNSIQDLSVTLIGARLRHLKEDLKQPQSELLRKIEEREKLIAADVVFGKLLAPIGALVAALAQLLLAF